MTNKQLILNFYVAFSQGDLDKILTYVTEDFIMHVPGKGLNAGEYWGKVGFKKFLINVSSYGGGGFLLSVPAVAVNGDVIFTREEISMNRKENPSQKWMLRLIMHYKIKDGLISEAWTIPMDPEVYDAYWTPGASLQTVDDVKSQINTAQTQVPDEKITENYNIVKKFYHFFWQNDLTAMSKLITSDFLFTVPGKSFLAGKYRNWSGYEDFRNRLISNVAGDKYKLELDSVAASANEVFVKEYIRMNRSWDSQVQTSFVILHFIIHQGKITQVNDVPVDSISYEEFFTKPNVAR